MIRLGYILVLVLWGNAVFSQNALAGYVTVAAENNPGLQSQFKHYLAALERVPQIGALPDPTVAFGYFIQPIETRLGPQQAKVSVSQMFPWFGTLSAREHSATAAAQAQFQLFENAKSKLFYEVKTVYYDLFFINKAIASTMENIEILSSLKGLASIKVESGSASAVDVFRVEMELNDLENQLALLRDNAGVLSTKFNLLLNVDPHSEIVIDDLASVGSLNSRQAELDSVLVRNYSLASIDYQLEGLAYQKSAAQKDGMPKLSLGLEYAFIGAGNSTASNAGQDAFMFPKIGVTIPLYRSKYKAKVQEVALLQEAKRFEKSDKENSLSILFEGIWRDYLDADRRLSLYVTQTELAKKSIAILESNYATSSAGFEEILRIERKLLKYSLELHKAKADKATAMAFVAYLQGQ